MPEEVTDNPTEETGISHAERMIFGDETKVPDDGYDSVSETETAPDAGNPETEEVKAPVVEEPVDEVAKPEETTGDEPKEEAKAETTDEPEESDEEKELKRIEDELLGVDSEPETDPVWKTRYEDACSHITRLEGDLNTKLEYLKSVGVEIVKTNDGFGLVHPEGYEPKQVDVSDIPTDAIFSKLTEVEKELLELDPAKACKVIAEKVALEIAAKRPAATAKREDAVLPPETVDSIYDDFRKEKLADGKTPRFPDSDDPAVRDRMAKAFRSNDPGMETLRKLASQDKVVNRFLLGHLWLKTFHAMHGAKARIADAKAQKEKAVIENKKGPTVSAPGSSAPAKGMQTGTTRAAESERLLNIIAPENADAPYS